MGTLTMELYLGYFSPFEEEPDHWNFKKMSGLGQNFASLEKNELIEKVELVHLLTHSIAYIHLSYLVRRIILTWPFPFLLHSLIHIPFMWVLLQGLGLLCHLRQLSLFLSVHSRLVSIYYWSISILFFRRKTSRGNPRDASPHPWMASLVTLSA